MLWKRLSEALTATSSAVPMDTSAQHGMATAASCAIEPRVLAQSRFAVNEDAFMICAGKSMLRLFFSARRSEDRIRLLRHE